MSPNQAAVALLESKEITALPGRKSGEYKVLTGNMSGCLLADYEIGQRKALKGLPDDGYLIKTIVTSNLAL